MSLELVKNPQAKWYVELSTRFERLVDNLELDQDAASEVKVFLLQIAKEQYMAGNRSGIRWARQGTSQPVAA